MTRTLLVLLIAALATFEARAEVFPVPLTRKNLLDRSAVVVVACKQQPNRVARRGRIEPSTGKPFPYFVSRWKLLETLWVRPGSVAPGQLQVVGVDQAALEREAVEGHPVEYELPEFREGWGNMAGFDTLILFLGEPNARGESPLVATESTLPPTAREEVRRMAAPGAAP